MQAKTRDYAQALEPIVPISRFRLRFLLHPNNNWEYGANVLHAYQRQLGAIINQ
jgi:hypothetical protein